MESITTTFPTLVDRSIDGYNESEKGDISVVGAFSFGGKYGLQIPKQNEYVSPRDYDAETKRLIEAMKSSVEKYEK